MIPFFCKFLLIIAGTLNIALFAFLFYRDRKKEINILRRMSGHEEKESARINFRFTGTGKWWQ